MQQQQLQTLTPGLSSLSLGLTASSNAVLGFMYGCIGLQIPRPPPGPALMPSLQSASCTVSIRPQEALRYVPYRAAGVGLPSTAACYGSAVL
jgi:hypothetical protein